MERERIKVKILGISCGHRKGMNTAWLVQYALKAAEKFGKRISQIAEVETEFVDLADKEIKPCRNKCEQRHMSNRGLPYKGTERPKILGCPIQDDYFALELTPKVREADGYVLGSPVFTLSFTSKFRLFSERCAPLVWEGYLTNKPAIAVAVGEWSQVGEETCLQDINRIVLGAEMTCVSWYAGVAGVSGPPYGPVPSSLEYNKVIGVKKDRTARWLAIYNGRRVAEIAVMLKLAKRELGEIYTNEFIQGYHPPHGEEVWAWRSLDKETEEFMDSLAPPEVEEA